MLAGRFQSVQVLKRRSGAETALAHDLSSGLRVVVKTIPASAISPGSQERVEQTVRLLRDARGPSLCAPIAAGRDGGLAWIAAPYVDGQPLSTLLAAKGPLDAAQAVLTARRLLQSLALSHCRGVLHGNISPSNVIISDDRATLIDFGFFRAGWIDRALRDEPLEAALYQAPEQAGALSAQVDQTADLYSLGVLLHESLTASNPFRAGTLGGVLRRHLTFEPPPLGRATPRELGDIVRRLLRKHPRDRYQSAEGVLADLETLGRSRGSRFVPGRREKRKTLAEPAFVARGAELDQLEEALARAAGGEGGLAAVEAPSGGGKSRLLDELAQRALMCDARVLRGTCADREAPVPFQILAQAAAAISALCGEDAGLAGRVRAAAGDDGAALAAAFPELLRLLGPGASRLDDVPLARVARGFAAMLASLGAPGRPALVLLDDVQWSTGHTGLSLEQLATAARPLHLLVVVAFRSEDAPREHWARTIPAQPRIVLSALNEEGVRTLCESMAGPLPAEVHATVAKLGAGNPFVCAAVLRGLVEAGALTPSASGWRADAGALEDVRSSEAAGTILAHRLDRLPPATRSLLSSGAVLGKSFELETAAALCGLGLREALDALEEGRLRHLVWLSADRRTCTLVHDKIRDALLARLPAEALRALHLGAARAHESRPGDWSFAIAYHYDAAAEPLLAFRHALIAAEQARARSAFETALRYFAIAERGSAAGSSSSRFRIAESLGYLMGVRGRFDEAVERLERARALAPERRDRLRVERLLAEIHFRRGAHEEGSRVVEAALTELGVHVPRTAVGFALRTALAGLWIRRPWRRARPVSEGEKILMELCTRLCLTYTMHRGRLSAVWAGTRATELAQLPGASPEAASIAFFAHALALSLDGRIGPSLDMAARAVELVRALGDPRAEGQIEHGRSVILSIACRFEEAVAIDRAVLPAFEKFGDVTYAGYARGRLATNLSLLGSLREAAGLAARFHREDAHPVDSQSLAFTLEVWSRAACGRIPASAVERARKVCRAPQELVAISVAEGIRLLADGKPEEAAREFEEAERVVQQTGLRRPYAGNPAVWIATALRRCADSLPAAASSRRAALFARALAASRRALRIARRSRESLPHALRERACLEAWSGSLQRAQASFSASQAVAAQLGMRAEAAWTRMTRGEIGLAAGWPGSADDAREGEAALRALGGAPLAKDPQPEATFSLVDRFNEVLRAGRAIASALTADTVHAAVLDAAGKLLRAEQCLLVSPDGHAGKGAEPGAGLARVARSAFASRKTERDDASIAAPILVHGEPILCLCAGSRPLHGLFGAEEERLAGFIASLAGAALENAEQVSARVRAEREVRSLSEGALRSQEDERKRLALALHDGAGQVLTAMSLQLSSLARAVPQPALGKVEGISAMAAGLLEDLRGLTHDLRPAALDRLGLPAALQDLAGSVATAALAVEVRIEPPGLKPGPDVSIALFRIAQAALGNLARHAHARRVTIALTSTERVLRLSIADDGGGFDPRTVTPGIGIIGMRERASWLGGEFHIESAPGRGTRVVVEVPHK
jgi:signal transduction histidine kinase